MCLHYDEDATKKFLKKNGKKKEVVVWKVYYVGVKGEVFPAFCLIIHPKKVRSGIILSNRQFKKLSGETEFKYGEVHRGIHVFLTRAAARNQKGLSLRTN